MLSITRVITRKKTSPHAVSVITAEKLTMGKLRSLSIVVPTFFLINNTPIHESVYGKADWDAAENRMGSKITTKRSFINGAFC